ncbi:NACHT domain-containing protein [Nakamurella sp.]|uniref:NACHT domain-containing protein n=1 Tax=Nakamurella sp. TaxID=1869182 RepID=UPI003B3A165B
MEPISTTIALAVAKAVLAKVALEVGTPAAKAARNRVFGNPEEQALASAVQNAFTKAAAAHSTIAASYDLNAKFLEHEAASELAKVLIPGADPSWAELAACCIDSLMPKLNPDERMDRIIELRAFCQQLIGELRNEVQRSSQLEGLVRRSDQARAVTAVERLARSVAGTEANEFDEVQYLDWIIQRHRYIRTAGIVRNTAIQVPLEDVFVDLLARRDRKPGDRAQAWYRQEQERLRAERDAGVLDQVNYDAALDRMVLQLGGRVQVEVESDPADDAISVVEASKNEKLLLVLGDPGGGKTTILRHLAFNHANALLNGRTEWDTRHGLARFPILVRIGDFARSPSRHLGLGSFIPQHLQAQECRCPGLADLIERRLESGNCLVLLDGLDEVASAEERRTVVEATMNFVNTHARTGNRFIITSRIAGYLGAPLPQSFMALRLEDMDDQTIERFLRSYCPAVERADAPDQSQETAYINATAEVEALLDALRANSGVRRLAANPLLLTALVLVHKARGRLPHRRVDAYVEVSEALARTWRSVQGVPEADLPDDQMLTAWLTRLGAWMHEFRPEGSVTSRELVEVLGPLWAKLVGAEWDATILVSANPSESTVGLAIQELITKIDVHTGLLTERSPGRYGFNHLTFEEYYAGRSLAFEGTAQGRAERFRRRLHNPRYDEPILLGLGLVGREQPEEVQLLMTTAVYGAVPNDSEDEDLLGRDFRFALRVVADGPPLETATVRSLMRQAVTEWFDPKSRCRFSAFNDALRLRLSGLGDTRAAGILLTETAAMSQSLSKDQPDRFALLVKILPDGPNIAVAAEALQTLVNLVLAIGQDPASSPELVVLAAEAVRDRAFHLRAELYVPLLRVLEDAGTSVPLRERAIWALFDTDEESTKRTLVGLVENENLPEALRSTALWRLGATLSPPTDFPKLIGKALRRTASGGNAGMDVAIAIAALPEAGKPEVVWNAMISQDAPEQLRRACLIVFGHDLELPPEALESIMAMVNDSDLSERTRSSAVEVLARLAEQPAVVERVREVLLSENYADRIRVAAAGVVGRICGKVPDEGRDYLVEILHKADVPVDVRVDAARAFGSFTNQSDACDTLIDLVALDNSPEIVFHQCADVIHETGSLAEVHKSKLQAIQQDPPSLRVLITVCWLLRRDLELSAAVARRMQDWFFPSPLDWRSRQKLIEVLGHLSEVQTRDLDFVLERFADEDDDVRRAVGNALAKFAQNVGPISDLIRERLRSICSEQQYEAADRYQNRPGWDFAYDALMTVAAVRIRSG